MLYKNELVNKVRQFSNFSVHLAVNTVINVSVNNNNNNNNDNNNNNNNNDNNNNINFNNYMQVVPGGRKMATEVRLGFVGEVRLGFVGEVRLGFVGEVRLGFVGELRFGFGGELSELFPILRRYSITKFENRMSA